MLTEAGIDGSTHSYLGNVTFHSATDTHIVENYQVSYVKGRYVDRGY